MSSAVTTMERASQLRFLTCGSVDDGKSTLIGRLLYDSKLIMDDHLYALESDSRKHGTTGEDIDFALLVDGLEAEREQGITIDVAYRFFTTPRRSFIVADTPGHEQYSRNMATGASNCDLAIILIDARKGVLTQTLRHSLIAHLLGIKSVVLAVNKMDLVDFDRTRFDEIVADYRAKTARHAFEQFVAIPMSARFGDNVTTRSERSAWYEGPTLIDHLEVVQPPAGGGSQAFRMPVQWINRPNLDFRGYSGTIVSGSVAVGDLIAVPRSGLTSRVTGLIGPTGPLDRASAGDAITLTISDEIDISRGDVLAPANDRPEVSNQFAAHLFWMAKDALMVGRPYLIKLGTATELATITGIGHRVDVNTGEHAQAKNLQMNEIGFCNIHLARPTVFEPYADNQALGSFIIIDRFSNQTVGAGMVEYGLRRGTNIHAQPADVTRQQLAAIKGQEPCVIWLTGLSGSGKSTIANILQRKLTMLGAHSFILDGDNVRMGLNKDLSFSEADRVENIRRVGEVAKLMVDAGLIVICSFISPFRADRAMVRELLPDGEFVEVHVDTPLDVAEARDVKGLYAKARAGKIKNFTGIDSPYEAPDAAEIVVDTAALSAEEAADAILARISPRLGRTA
ncbi:adenylyl-sulfate kinase [Sandarakinorhabdus cyanobacteriorum]|uniref:Multifunctional fusion protein n=1 Tax=Sandarakinorhabdus cyanobacteriorum TaxID=1981098 RepID=A0A255YAN3_9SPHN|nr:sulfate adenylyltransferase subunit CysN [Sandarakinorhabdus cyanobacteriorum]OYQ25754.1 adenylyl-sulfate kinase [Sandarakinorhabdus cyanobacteriorum]